MLLRFPSSGFSQGDLSGLGFSLLPWGGGGPQQGPGTAGTAPLGLAMGLHHINSELLPPKMKEPGLGPLSGVDREMAPWGVINEHLQGVYTGCCCLPSGNPLRRRGGGG